MFSSSCEKEWAAYKKCKKHSSSSSCSTLFNKWKECREEYDVPVIKPGIGLDSSGKMTYGFGLGYADSATNFMNFGSSPTKK